MKGLGILGWIVLFIGCSSAATTPTDTGDTEPDTAADTTSDTAVDTGTPETTAEDINLPTDPYTITVFDNIRINSTGDVNVRDVVADVDLAGASFEQVTMRVELASTCYPFESWTQPPAGHNWPADCDAYDRNFEFTLDDPKEEGDPPAFELVRAITPFGGPMTFEVDLTDLANARPGQHSIRAHISTWSDGAGQVSGSAGGWNVTTHIDVVPGTPPRNVLAAIPLVSDFHGKQDPFTTSLTLPEGTTSTRLEYRVTGHGGGDPDPFPTCIGPAEEFCQRTHIVYADGVDIDQFLAWRDDCEDLCTLETHPNGGFQYCVENPCGNVQSVKASRANWCPGDVTPPFVWTPEQWTSAGPHTFSYSIPEQGNGSWRVSATAYAYGD